MKVFLVNFVAVLAGLAVMFLLLIAVEFLSDAVHPRPDTFSGTKEEMCQHVERYPAWVLAVVVPLWALVAFISSWVARRIGSIYSFAIVGLLLLAALLLNLSMLPYPIWFKLANVIVIPIAVVTALSGQSFPTDTNSERRETGDGMAAV